VRKKVPPAPVVKEAVVLKIRKNRCSRTFIGWRAHQGLELTGFPSGEAGASSNITSRTNNNNTLHTNHPRTDNDLSNTAIGKLE
jgi:hypothetical protein